jgi:hypothetical protein
MLQAIWNLQRSFSIQTPPPSGHVRNAAWAVLHANNFSYRQTGLAFGCDHKTVREHVLPVESDLRNAPLSKPLPKPDRKARDYSGLVQHFILFALLERDVKMIRKVTVVHSTTSQFPSILNLRKIISSQCLTKLSPHEILNSEVGRALSSAYRLLAPIGRLKTLNPIFRAIIN